ncbi:TPA: DUF3265 domain-containing protein [Vibrio vulnificus]|nr:DUF3265 domain-containing protein [Vibrio vulnificus]
MTRRLSGIHAAWHFWYAVVFGGESGLRKVDFGGIHPLTRRYKSKRRKKKAVWVSKKLILLVLNGLMLMGQKSFTLKNRMH